MMRKIKFLISFLFLIPTVSHAARIVGNGTVNISTINVSITNNYGSVISGEGVSVYPATSTILAEKGILGSTITLQNSDGTQKTFIGVGESILLGPYRAYSYNYTQTASDIADQGQKSAYLHIVSSYPFDSSNLVPVRSSYITQSPENIFYFINDPLLPYGYVDWWLDKYGFYVDNVPLYVGEGGALNATIRTNGSALFNSSVTASELNITPTGVSIPSNYTGETIVTPSNIVTPISSYVGGEIVNYRACNYLNVGSEKRFSPDCQITAPNTATTEYSVQLDVVIPLNADGVRISRSVNGAGFLDGEDFTADGTYYDTNNYVSGIVWTSTKATALPTHTVVSTGSYISTINGNMVADNLDVSNNVVANKFYGDGSNLTGIISGTSGSSVYPATDTVSFPYGLSASTGVFSSSVTALAFFGNGANLTGIPAGSGASVYPATATASFPYGLSASTIVATGIISGSSATFTGNVGIGTTTPSYKLDVNGVMRSTGVIALNLDCTGNTNGGKVTTLANGEFVCANDVSGAGGTGTTISVEDNGSQVVDTSTMNFTGAQFVITNSDGKALVTLDASSVTLMGTDVLSASSATATYIQKTSSQAISATSFGISLDGGGSAITTGIKGFVTIPYAMTITGWDILGDQSGSIVVDVWKDTYANYPPTVADTIAGSEKPTISSALKGQDNALTTWTTSVSAGDIIGFNVDSCSTLTRATIVVKGNKTL